MFDILFRKYYAALSNETEILNKARIRILTQGLLAFIFLRALLLVFSVSFSIDSVWLWLSTLFFIAFIVAFGLLLSGISWRLVGHVFLWCLTLLILSNLFLYGERLNLVILQNTLLILTVGYYLLGAKWGLFYSLINIIPVVASVILTEIGYTHVSRHLAYNSIALHFTLVFNFALLLYIHYYFFKAFKKTNEKEQEFKAELQKSLKAAEDIVVAKTNFLSSMSHELRTPLNAVVGVANLLLMESHSEHQKENLNVLLFSAENLITVVNDIADLNKIGAGSITLQQQDFRLNILLKNVYGAFKEKAEDKDIEFSIITNPGLENMQLTGDAARLTQILFKLVGNSIKFTQSGFVKLEVKTLYRDDTKARLFFKVEDTGIGISPDQQENIFEPFAKTQSRTNRQYHGTGLGLAIANKLIAMHNSELKLYSTEGKGTIFEFELDYLVAEMPEPESDDKETPPPASSLKVLVAEDNDINVLIIKKFLKLWNIEHKVVGNGMEAVMAVEEGEFDVILMDINMPVMDGFEASKLIREFADRKKAAIPIIALTASVGLEIEKHSGFKYLDDSIIKPFKPEVLKGKLDDIRQYKSFR